MVNTPNVGCPNPHRVASYNFVGNKFCKPSVNDCLYSKLPLLPFFTFLGCFHFSSVAGVFIFYLSLVFSFVTLLSCFIFHLFRVVLCWCTASAAGLRELFYSQAFFTLHSFPTFGTAYFIKALMGDDSSSLKVAGAPTEVQNTNSAHQCSAKGISW